MNPTERKLPSRPPIDTAPARSSFLPIVLALGVLGLVCVGLFFLTGGFFGIVLIIGGGVFALAAVHYLVWGWWLSGIIREDVAAEEQSRNEG